MSTSYPKSIPAIPLDPMTNLALNGGLGALGGMIGGGTGSASQTVPQTALSGGAPVSIGGSGSGQRGGYYANFQGGGLSNIFHDLMSNPMNMALALGGVIVLFFLYKKL